MTLRFSSVRILFIFLFSFVIVVTQAQTGSLEEALLKLNQDGAMPAKILNSRSLVLHSYDFTPAQLKTIHENLVKTGIDAVAYFESDRIFSGNDFELAYSDYFTKREIQNFVIILKENNAFKIIITPYNNSSSFFNAKQNAWVYSHSKLKEVLDQLYRIALSGNTKKNLLINEIPEKGLTISAIQGNRIEAFSYDLKVDKLAVPKFEDSLLNAQLEEVMKTYPFKYELTDPSIPEEELKRKGFYYILRFVHARNIAAKELLGYDITNPETAFVSMTYPNGEVKLKTIPTNVSVFKFYIRKINPSNTYIGTKWDADTTWQQALLNHIKSFKAELRIN